MTAFPQSFSLISTTPQATGPTVTGTASGSVPALTATFTAPTGKSVLGGLFGVGVSTNIAGAFGSTFASPTWVASCRSQNFALLRVNGEVLMREIFASATASPDFTALNSFIANYKQAFPSAQLMWTGGWLPSYFAGWSTASVNACANQFAALASHLQSSGIHVNYWDGIFNEPNIAGLENAPGSVSASDVGTVSAACFKTIAQVDAQSKFTGPTTSGFNPAYTSALIGACATANQRLDGISYHYYNAVGAEGAANTWNHQVNFLTDSNGTNVSWGNDLRQSTTLPCSVNEYNFNEGEGTQDGNHTITAAVNSALIAATGVRRPEYQMSGATSAIWQLDPSDGIFNVIDPSGNIRPVGSFLSKAGQVMAGSMVTCTDPSATLNLYTLATVNGSHFALMLINYSTTTAVTTGQIGLSQWPLNATGTASINRWQISPSATNGALTALSVTAGLTSAITLPALSVTILYS